MRVYLHQDRGVEEFSKRLLDIGDENIPEVKGKNNLPYNLGEVVEDQLNGYNVSQYSSS